MGIAHKALTSLMRPSAGAAPSAETGDDATVKIVDLAMRRLLDRPLPEAAKPWTGTLVHYAFGGGVGGVYGAVAERVSRVTTAVGLPFGVAVWLGAHVIAVPAAGLAPPPTRRPLSAESVELVLHLVYGAVTELVRRLLRGHAAPRAAVQRRV
jgi:hypothetical protein